MGILRYYSKVATTSMMKKLILTALLLTVALGVWAQHTISGTVTDSRSGETLIGATIYDTISRKGTITNHASTPNCRAPTRCRK